MNQIFIYDDIGPEWMGMVGAKTIIDELAKIGDEPVTVRINSPGGSCTEGQAIYNAFIRHKGEVTMEIDSLAASMGSYIAMAGDVINIAENAMIMIHSPWTLAIGSADELRQAAGVLDKFEESCVGVYSKRSGQKPEDVQQMMKDETWLTAKDAVAKGFANAISQEMKDMQAKVKPGRFAKTPEQFITGKLPRETKRENTVSVVREQLRIARARMGV